jgi:aldehyde oxidoreductase
VRFTLNGRSVEIEVEAGMSLLDLLRDGCGLRSMKDGCSPEGSCGACTVIVDGRAAVSCAQPAGRAAGRDVITLEGLAPAVRDLWADAFVAGGAFQCGYCTPGIVMKAEALLRRRPLPSREEIARALAGNLCRCTGYVKIVDSIEAVAAVRRGDPTDRVAGSALGDAPRGARAAGSERCRDGRVGTPAARYEGRQLVLGEQPFVGDMTAPGMLHAALSFAGHPRAIVRRIDVSRAAALPGVVRVVTWRDVPGQRHQGLITADWPLLVAEGETTRYVGDVLAAIAAETRAAAREAASLVDVEYEVLEPVTDPAAALAGHAAPVHAAGNLLSESVVRRGDVDRALTSAAHVVRETFRTQSIEHAFLEPEACLAVPAAEARAEAVRVGSGPGTAARDEDLAAAPIGAGSPLLRVYSQGQGAWEDRRQIASFLGLPERSVRVTQVATGGAFGGKEDLGVQGHTALLALITGRPVLLKLSRAESIRFHPKRHPMTLAYTAGCDADGRLVAVRARIIGDTGAYASVGAKVLERAAGHACGAYRVPNVDVEALAVYTNNPPAGAMRGFGVVQATFALEGVLDRLAALTGIDGWEIRWRNALDAGDRFGTGQVLGPGVGVKRTLLAVRDAYRSARFAGIACAAKNTGIGNGMVERGRAVLRPEADGSVTLFHSWTEMGQGVHTILRQIACEELQIAPDRIRVVVDTDHELDTGETTASRGSTLGGQAVIDAARKLRAALDAQADVRWEAVGTDAAGDLDRRVRALAGHEYAGEFVVDWTTAIRDGLADPVTHFAYGWATQVVVLDDEGRLAKVIAAHDAGRVLNPTLLEGQVEGGVHMGLGYALSEEFVLDGGVPVTDTLKSLGIIPPAGMPPVECILVEEPQPEGPYGAKGAGEAVLVPTPAAVAGALHAFDGVWRTTLPMTDSTAARAAVPRLARAMAPRAAGAAAPRIARRSTGGE